METKLLEILNQIYATGVNYRSENATNYEKMVHLLRKYVLNLLLINALKRHDYSIALN